MKKSPKKGDAAQNAWAVVQEATVDAGLEARRINEVLLGRGLSQVKANSWWDVGNVHLGYRTPNQVWLGEETPSATTVETVRDAAENATEN